MPNVTLEKSTCRLKGCISPAHKRNLCRAHYSEWRAAKAKYEHNQRLERSKSYVYAVITLELDEERVKFGRSKSPKRRFSGIQGGSPVKLGLGACVFGGEELERLIHAACSNERLHGEWFRLAGTAEKIFDLMREQKISELQDLLDLNKHAIMEKQRLAR